MAQGSYYLGGNGTTNDTLERVAFKIMNENGRIVREYDFSLNPQNIDEQIGARNDFVQTLRNINMQGYGQGLHTIKISGTTGFYRTAVQRHGPTGHGTGFQKLKALQGIIMQQINNAHDLGQNQPGMTTLYYCDYTNGNSWRVEMGQDGIEIQRSTDDPLSYYYTISMVVIANAATPNLDEITHDELGSIMPQMSQRRYRMKVPGTTPADNTPNTIKNSNRNRSSKYKHYRPKRKARAVHRSIEGKLSRVVDNPSLSHMNSLEAKKYLERYKKPLSTKQMAKIESIIWGKNTPLYTHIKWKGAYPFSVKIDGAKDNGLVQNLFEKSVNDMKQRGTNQVGWDIGKDVDGYNFSKLASQMPMNYTGNADSFVERTGDDGTKYYYNDNPNKVTPFAMQKNGIFSYLHNKESYTDSDSSHMLVDNRGHVLAASEGTLLTFNVEYNFDANPRISRTADKKQWRKGSETSDSDELGTNVYHKIVHVVWGQPQTFPVSMNLSKKHYTMVDNQGHPVKKITKKYPRRKRKYHKQLYYTYYIDDVTKRGVLKRDVHQGFAYSENVHASGTLEWKPITEATGAMGINKHESNYADREMVQKQQHTYWTFIGTGDVDVSSDGETDYSIANNADFGTYSNGSSQSPFDNSDVTTGGSTYLPGSGGQIMSDFNGYTNNRYRYNNPSSQYINKPIKVPSDITNSNGSNKNIHIDAIVGKSNKIAYHDQAINQYGVNNIFNDEVLSYFYGKRKTFIGYDLLSKNPVYLSDLDNNFDATLQNAVYNGMDFSDMRILNPSNGEITPEFLKYIENYMGHYVVPKNVDKNGGTGWHMNHYHQSTSTNGDSSDTDTNIGGNGHYGQDSEAIDPNPSDVIPGHKGVAPSDADYNPASDIGHRNSFTNGSDTNPDSDKGRRHSFTNGSDINPDSDDGQRHHFTNGSDLNPDSDDGTRHHFTNGSDINPDSDDGIRHHFTNGSDLNPNSDDGQRHHFTNGSDFNPDYDDGNRGNFTNGSDNNPDSDEGNWTHFTNGSDLNPDSDEGSRTHFTNGSDYNPSSDIGNIIANPGGSDNNPSQIPGNVGSTTIDNENGIPFNDYNPVDIPGNSQPNTTPANDDNNPSDLEGDTSNETIDIDKPGDING